MTRGFLTNVRNDRVLSGSEEEGGESGKSPLSPPSQYPENQDCHSEWSEA